MEKSELAKRVYDCSHLTGSFLLRSGQTSEQYFDKYQFEARPQILAAIAEHLEAKLPKDFDVLGAMEMGGIPIATAIALRSHSPLVFIRKEAKAYGTCKFAEGFDVEGKTVCIVEDVITTGGAVVNSVKMLREKGATVTDVLCVIDRSGGEAEGLTKMGLRLTSLFNLEDFS